MNWIDQSIGLSSRSLIFRAQRSEVLAANIANADTPNYKARDLNFSEVLQQTAPAFRTTPTHPRHIPLAGNPAHPESIEREQNRAAPDGNTVEPEVEQSEYAENAVRFQASAQFLDGTINGLRKAWRGE